MSVRQALAPDCRRRRMAARVWLPPLTNARPYASMKRETDKKNDRLPRGIKRTVRVLRLLKRLPSGYNTGVGFRQDRTGYHLARVARPD